jgi:AcrR family transcriptional regulator
VTKRPAQTRPRQARSRESLRRMLDAVEVVLDRYGLEGATLPRIAAEAGLSPANVYRRFRDKDSLMGAVFSRATAARTEDLERPIDLDEVRKIGIRNFADNWIASMVRGFSARPGLLRATILYSQQHPKAPFIHRQKDLEMRGFRKMVETFLGWREEIHHPDPERAVPCAMVMVALLLREFIVFNQAEAFRELTPLSDKQLQNELSRVFLGYLGVKPG